MQMCGNDVLDLKNIFFTVRPYFFDTDNVNNIGDDSQGHSMKHHMLSIAFILQQTS